MKKIIKKSFKTLGYIFLYVIVTLATAVGVFFVSQKKPEPNKPTEVLASQVSTMYSKLLSAPALDVDLDADIVTNSQSFNVKVKASLNLKNGFDKLETFGQIEVDIFDQTIPASFTYKGGVIYLDVLGGKFKISTDDLLPTISKVMALVGVNMPELNLSLDNLDINGILALLSNFEESSDENNIYLDVTVPVVGTIRFVCNEEYEMQSVIVPTTTIKKSTSIALNADIKYPEAVSVEQPNAQEFTDATDILDAAELILDYTKSSQIGLKLEANFEDFDLAGTLSVDLEKSTLLFETTLLEKNLKLLVIDNTIYVELGNLNLKFNLKDLPDALELLKNKFDLNLPIENLTKILGAVKNANISSLLQSVDTSKLAFLEKLDLSVLESFEKSENGYEISIKDVGNIKINSNKNKFAGVEILLDNFHATLTDTEPSKIELARDQADYIDVAQLLPSIDAIIETSRLEYIAGSGEVSLGDLKFGVEFGARIAGELRVHARLTYNAQEILVDYYDDKLLVNVNGFTLVAKEDDLGAIVELVKKYGFEDKLSALSLPMVMPNIEKVLDMVVSEKIIENIVAEQNKLSLTLLGKLFAELEFDEFVTSVKLEFGNMFARLNIDNFGDEYIFPAVDELSAVPASDIISLADPMLNYLQNKQLGLDVTINSDKLNLSGLFSLDIEKSQLMFETELMGQNLKVLYIGKIIYVELGNVNAKFNIADLPQVAELLKDKLNLDLPTEAILGVIFGGIDIKAKLETMDKFDLSIIEKFERLSSSYKIVIRDLGTIEIAINGNTISGVNFANDDLNANISTTSPNKIKLTKTENEYINLVDLLPSIKAIWNSLENGYISGSGEVALGDLKFGLEFGTRIAGELRVHARLTYNAQEILVDYYDDKLFVNVNGFTLVAQEDDLGAIVELVKKYGFEDKLSALSLPMVMPNIEKVLDMVVSEKIIDNIVASQNKLSLTLLGKLFAELEFDEFVTSVRLEFGNMFASLNLNRFGEEYVFPAVDEVSAVPASDIISLADPLLNYMQNKQLGLDVTINSDKLNLSGLVSLDLEKSQLMFETEFMGQKLKVLYIGKTIFVELGNINAKFNIADLPQVAELLKDKLNLNLPTEAILGVIFGGIDIKAKLETMDKFDLSIIEKFERLTSGYKIVIRDLGTIEVAVSGNTIAGINFVNDNLNANISTTAPSEIKLAKVESEYINLVDLLPSIKAIWNSLENGYISGSGEVTFGDLKFGIEFGAKIVGELRVHARLTYNAQEILVDYYDEKLFVNVNGFTILAQMNDIDAVLDLLNKYGVKVNKPASDTTVGDLIDPNKNDKLIDNLFASNNKLSLTLLGKLFAELEFDEFVTSISLRYSKLSAKLNLDNSNTEYVFPAVDEVSAVPASDIISLADPLLNYMQNKQLGLDVTINSDKLNLSGLLSLDLEKSQLMFETELLGQQLKVLYIGKTIFVELGNINAKFNIADLPQVAELLKDKLNLDLPTEAILGAIFGGIDIKAKLETMDKLDLSVIESFERLTSSYKIVIRDLGTIEIAVNGNTIAGVNFANDTLNANISTTAPSEIKLAKVESEYINIVDLLPSIKAIWNSLENGYISGSGSANLAGQSATLDFKVSFAGKLRANVVLNIFGQTILIDYFDKQLYVSYKGVKITGTLDDYKGLLPLLEEFKVEMPSLPSSVEELLSPQTTLLNELCMSDHNLSFNLLGKFAIGIDFGEYLSSVSLTYNDMNVTLNVNEPAAEPSFDNLNGADYESAASFIEKITTIVPYALNKQFYLTFGASYNKDITFNGALNYDSNGFILSANSEIKGIAFNLIYQDNIIYVKVGNFNLKLEFSKLGELFEFLKTEFNIELPEEYMSAISLVSDMSNSIKSIDIESLLNSISLSLVGNTLTVQTDDLLASIELASKDITQTDIHIEAKGVVASAYIKLEPNDIELENEYFDVTEIMPFIKIIKDYVLSKQFNITADAVVNDKDSHDNSIETYKANGIQLQIDLQNILKFYAKANVVGTYETTSDTNINLEAILGQQYMFVDYNGLAVKMINDDLQELLKIIFKFLNINDVVFEQIVNLASNKPVDLKALINSLSSTNLFDNPSYIVNMFTKFAVNGNTLSISLDGSAVTIDQRALSMEIDIVTDGTTLKMIRLKNMYTGVTTSEHFNLDVYFNDFDQAEFEKLVTAPENDAKYKDVSGANELVDAFANTAKNLTTFTKDKNFNTVRVQGNLQVNALGNYIDWQIPIDLQFKLIGKKDGNNQTTYDTEIFAEVGPIPVKYIFPIGYLNDDTGWKGVKDRKVYIYYKEGNVYFYRTETNPNNSSQTYQKTLKVSLQTLMNDDILYYLKWITGLDKTYIDLIRKDMENNKNNKPDLSKALTSFTPPNQADNNTSNYVIKLDLGALTGNSNLEGLTVGIGTSSYNDNSVLSRATLELSMVKGIIKISSADLTATLDDPLDSMEEKYYSFIESFKTNGGQESTEYEAYNNEWGQAKRTYTVTFSSEHGTLAQTELTADKDSEFALQNFDNITVDQTEYYFDGWFTDASCSDEFRFSSKGDTKAYVPSYNITLYAKWTIINAWRTINYYDYFKQLVTSETYQVVVNFEYVDLDLLSGRVPETLQVERESGKYLDTVRFAYWATEDGYRYVKVPMENINLYATYEIEDTLTRYNLDIFTGAGNNNLTLNHFVYNSKDFFELLPLFEVGKEIELTVDGAKHKFKFVGWFLDAAGETPLTSYTMPNSDLEIYAVWEEVIPEKLQYLLTVFDGEIEYTAFVEEDTELDLTSMALTSTNETAVPLRYIAGVTELYTSANFDASTKVSALPLRMPSSALTLYIRNKYTLKVIYYKATGTKPEKVTEELSLWQGESFTLNSFASYEVDYKNGDVLDYRDGYRFDGVDLTFQNPIGRSDKQKRFLPEEMVWEMTMANYDMTFEYVVTTLTLRYYKVTFNGEWKDPSYVDTDTNREKTKTIYLLEGSYVQGTTVYVRKAVLTEEYEQNTSINFSTKLKKASDRLGWTKYEFNSLGYNTTGVKNLYKSLKNDAANSARMDINEATDLADGNNDRSITFYCEWGWKNAI